MGTLVFSYFFDQSIKIHVCALPCKIHVCALLLQFNIVADQTVAKQ